MVPTLLWVGLLACAPSRDPLEAARLEALNQTWEVNEGPHARLWLSGQAVGALLAGLVPRKSEVSAGGVRAINRMQTPEVRFSRSTACDGCAGIRVVWSGTLTLDAGIVASPEVAWTAEVTGVVELLVTDPTEDDAEQRVRLRSWREPEVSVALDALPEVARPLLEPVGQLVRSTLSEELRKVPPLARLPFPIRATKVVTRGEGSAVRLDLSFAGVPDPTVPLTLKKPRRGWAAALPDSTVEALVRHQLLVDAPDRYNLEVRDITVGEQAFAMGARVWRTGRREAWQDFVVTGVPVIAEDPRRLVVSELVVQSVAREGWRGRVATPFVRKRVMARLAGALGEDHDSEAVVALPAREALLQVEGVGLDGGLLRVRGSLR